MTLKVPQGEEWHLYILLEEPQQRPEPPFKVPGVWAEDIPPRLVARKPGVEPTLQR